MLAGHTTLLWFLIRSVTIRPAVISTRSSWTWRWHLQGGRQPVALSALRDGLGAATTRTSGRVSTTGHHRQHLFLQRDRARRPARRRRRRRARGSPTCSRRAGRGKYLLVTDPLDGSSDIDVNVSVRQHLLVLRAPRAGEGRDSRGLPAARPGTVCAGYAVRAGDDAWCSPPGAGCTRSPSTRPGASSSSPGVDPRFPRDRRYDRSRAAGSGSRGRRYVDEVPRRPVRTRHRDFNMRWIASLVAETHRIPDQGGVPPPRDLKDPAKPGPAAAALREPTRSRSSSSRPAARRHGASGSSTSPDNRPAPARAVHLRVDRRGRALIDRYHREH
ncbi:hypothetical protein HBB16_11500 [Pseudonocardia sp. MCCB 268]|nr:hypothetical protein [Pseudonocardia cytotoxica]